MTLTSTDLVLGVVDLRGFPVSVHLIIPVVGLLGIRVSDVLRLVPILGLLVLRVIDVLVVVPVIGLLCIRVLNNHTQLACKQTFNTY